LSTNRACGYCQRLWDSGYIRQRGNGSYQVIVYAGQDPLAGKDRRLTGTAQTRKEVERLRTRLLSEVDEGRVSGNNATVAQVLQRWLETVDREFTTRQANEALIATKILPALGAVPARKLTVEVIERFYAELRKRGGVEGRPLSGSSVRRVHAILRAGLKRAVKWGWIPRISRARRCATFRQTRRGPADARRHRSFPRDRLGF
jgi:integrase